MYCEMKYFCCQRPTYIYILMIDGRAEVPSTIPLLFFIPLAPLSSIHSDPPPRKWRPNCPERHCHTYAILFQSLSSTPLKTSPFYYHGAEGTKTIAKIDPSRACTIRSVSPATIQSRTLLSQSSLKSKYYLHA